MLSSFYRFPTPFKLALISDCHNKAFFGLTESLRQNRPEVICIAGDFVHGDLPKYGNKMKESANALELIKRCVSVAKTYISLGNHEYLLTLSDIEMIQSTGAIVLDNSWTVMNGTVFGGLTSGGVLNYRKFRDELNTTEVYPKPLPEPRALKHEPYVNWLSEFEKQPGYKILLCHQPEYYDRYLDQTSIDLILSGHAHGGQIRIFNHGLYAPDQGFWPKYTSGCYDNRLIVSRGIANSSRIPRINNPTEIVYISPDCGLRM